MEIELVVGVEDRRGLATDCATGLQQRDEAGTHADVGPTFPAPWFAVADVDCGAFDECERVDAVSDLGGKLEEGFGLRSRGRYRLLLWSVRADGFEGCH